MAIQLTEKQSIVKTDDYMLINGDCVEELRKMPEESVDLAVFSPPFASLFTYSNDISDMGNTDDKDDEFKLHFRFFLESLFHVMKQGRIVCLHMQQLATLKGRDGFVGLKDFRGWIIEMAQETGFNYFGEWAIRKNPQLQAIAQKVRSLAFAQLESDRLGSKPGLSDFILIFKKPGDAAVKVNNNEVSREEWINWAQGVWSDIKETDTLQVRGTKGDGDVKHVCPLQLPVINRCVRMYSMPGEVVLSPFAGIGSEGYESLKLGRKFVGIELKREYFEKAVDNMERALEERDEPQQSIANAYLNEIGNR